MARRALAVCGLALLVLLLPAAAHAYQWPVRPFYEPHAIRGYFNDPRLGGDETNFHFGVDISAPDGERVYAIEPGWASVRNSSVAVRSARGLTFSYWHIIPAVRNRQRVRRFQLVGRVMAGAEHVHLGEKRGATYVNPLRIGALAPYVDDTVPAIPAMNFYIAGQPIRSDLVRGVVDLTVDAYDPSPLPLPPAPWAQSRLSPALIRWRIVQGHAVVRSWQTAVDFRSLLLPSSLFSSIYAPGTFENRPGRPGRYEFYLARNLNTDTLPNGSYLLEVEALDEQENVGKGALAFIVTNGTPP